jgi:HAD superfamily hydrolase (TIGR01509 family)
MYKALIFDFFNVIHADPLLKWMNMHGLTRAGKVAEASRQLDLGNIDVKEFIHRLSEVTGQTPAEVDAELKTAVWLDTDLVAYIDRLRKSYAIALVSNAGSDYIRGLLQNHDLERLFHHVVVSSEVGYAKPDPEIFYHILTLLDVQASEAIFVDDNPHNTDVAEGLGICSIVYQNLAQLQADLAHFGIKIPPN